MLDGKTIAVVVPAYNEESQISIVIDTMPDFVDRIVIVNDNSTDTTEDIVKKYIKSKANTIKIKKPKKEIKKGIHNKAEEVLYKLEQAEQEKHTPQEIVNEQPETSKIILINHLQNASVGAAIASGYKWCKDHQIDVTAVMAGDAQMDPDELESIVRPIVDDPTIDYVKGNRLSHRSALLVVPKIRYIGNSVLSLMTKIASGYWHVSDTQTGYTAISLAALNSIRLYDIYPSYGVPNDILVKLNIAFCTIAQVPIKPVYDVGEQSKMKVAKVVPKISWLLFKLFWVRLYRKYLFRDFHPLFLLYHFSFLLMLINIPFALQVFRAIPQGVTIDTVSLLIFIFLTISSLQGLFFAMWMDMMDNERLQR